MKSATIHDIKKELKLRDPGEVMELCSRLVRFKKENKEFLTYLLFESEDEAGYITGIKTEMDEQFVSMNTSNLHLIKKSIRKILRGMNKFIRFSGIAETETELRIYFCFKFKSFPIDLSTSPALNNIYQMQLKKIAAAIAKMHEDLQYDYQKELESLL